MSTNLPETAVEAAACAEWEATWRFFDEEHSTTWDDVDEDAKETWRVGARAALMAALPHLAPTVPGDVAVLRRAATIYAGHGLTR